MRRTVPLKRTAQIVAGQSPPSGLVSDLDGSELPFLQGNAEFGQLHPLPRLQCDLAPKNAEPGDVLLSVRAPVGALNVADRRYGIGRGLCAIRPGRDLDHRFAWWMVVAMAPRLSAVATGSTYDAVSADDVATLPMPLPPPAAQRAVADYLDRETSRVDALIGARQRMLELLEERWEAFRAASVSGATSQSERVRSGLRWLGSVPDNWSIERLKFLARMESGHTPDKKVEAYWVDCSIPWITLNDVGLLEHQWSITQPINAINELGMANSAAHILPEGTVVLSRDATVGRSAILGRPMTVSQHFVGWIPGPRLMPEYLLHVLRGPMQRHFATLTAGATIATIGMHAGAE